MRPLKIDPLYYWLNEKASHRVDSFVKRIARDKNISAEKVVDICKRVAVRLSSSPKRTLASSFYYQQACKAENKDVFSCEGNLSNRIRLEEKRSERKRLEERLRGAINDRILLDGLKGQYERTEDYSNVFFAVCCVCDAAFTSRKKACDYFPCCKKKICNFICEKAISPRRKVLGDRVYGEFRIVFAMLDYVENLIKEGRKNEQRHRKAITKIGKN